MHAPGVIAVVNQPEGPRLAASLRLQGVWVLVAGQVVSQGAVFLRNVVIVRALSPEAYGVATTLLLALMLVQAATNFELERLFIQSEKGEDKGFQESFQLFRFLQGCVAAGVLFAASPLFVQVFDVPGLQWGFATLALAPLIGGLLHMDPQRAERRSDFRQVAFVRGGTQLLVLLLVVWVAPLLPDFRLVIVAGIAQAVIAVGLSHLRARRSYGFALDPSVMRWALAVGWPLLANGFLLVAINQWERLLIGASAFLSGLIAWGSGGSLDIGKDDLAVYSVAIGVALVVNELVAGTLGSFLLPPLSRSQRDPARFRLWFVRSLSLCVLAAGSAGVFLIVAGVEFIEIVYTSRYAAVRSLMVPVAGLLVLRILRQWASLTLMSTANTRSLLITNLVRGMVLPISLVVMLEYSNITMIAWAAAGGEMLSLVAGVFLACRRTPRTTLPSAEQSTNARASA